MSKFQLFINKFAEKDLENSKKYYNEQSEELGTVFLLDLKATIKRIEQNPFQFPKIEKEARKANLDKFPFSVFFVVDNLLISIFSIFHTSRNPKIWENRIAN